MTGTRQPDAGFTLIEVLVALVLFALISGAGFALLDQVMRTQAQTEGRLERLAEVQRAMFVLTQDFLQARGRSYTVVPGESGLMIGLRRSAVDLSEGAVAIVYRLQNGSLQRVVSRPMGIVLAEQTLLPGVVAMEWRQFDPQAGWTADWPPDGLLPGALAPNPRAVEVRLTLAEGSYVRRVALLPRDGG